MTIDWEHFSPWTALAGGVLIGLAAVALMALQGRVLGVSGILAGAINGPDRGEGGERGWRLALLAGLLVSPWVAAALGLGTWVAAPRFDTPLALLVLGGLLVGWGTRRGGGCTSGHGVCGLSRLSARSLVATLCFMAAGVATVAVVRHVLT